MISEVISNACLLAFAVAFMGCVFFTPVVTRIASRLGAIDRPDQFRRVHKGAIPRLGGLGLAFGLGLSIVTIVTGGYLRDGSRFIDLWTWWWNQWPVMLATAIVLAVGIIDDTWGMRPRLKLLGQAIAVLALILGGIQIRGVVLLGVNIPFDFAPNSAPSFLDLPLHPGALPMVLVTLFWFLGCMNVWNLIDGMDGLASGVGVLVSGTLMLVAIYQQNTGSAVLAAALAGSLGGFLLYNWHPACIFLGDSGSLLLGLLIGLIGVQDSLKGTTTVSILFPILAMGLPISDTAMAIFRRWVRNLPLTAADRQHVHHLLLGLGLDPRKAALVLYVFTLGLCGVVLLGVALHSELLALLLGLSGCLGFLLILTSRRDELARLRDDLRHRLQRGRQERYAAKITWETIQKIELCHDPDRIWELIADAAEQLGCDALRMTCHRDGRTVLRKASVPEESWEPVSGATATFRLPSGQDLLLTVSLHQSSHSALAADIAFRFLQRLALATAERMERLLAEAPGEAVPVPLAGAGPLDSGDQEVAEPSLAALSGPTPPVATLEAIGPVMSGWLPLGRLRRAFGGAAEPVPRRS
ncbi:MAG: undecaprenyl/decaprenyl-phosphate alpha-N-acetylglucosaminyl 1-phosphate transferase [Isosphaeraceae bacterium]|nr:undecaprenyl/decaprenyl-phosphate alpha-N-acetylglucosaminyl 1-phosphate transferase [Isosphaeraceae bacterium]